MTVFYFSLLLIALAIAIALLPVLNRLARGCGWVDAPDERKTHVGAVPLTGGLTIAASAMAAWVVSYLIWPEHTRLTGGLVNWPHFPWSTEVAGLLVGLLICFGVGFWDDRFPLRARYRLIAQLSAAGCAVVAGNVLTSMGTTFSPTPLGLSLLAAPVTVIAVTGVVNAFNMSDGLDGLCGGYVAVALGAFALCAGLLSANGGDASALAQVGPIVLPFLGAVVGFLFYNMRHPWRDRAASFLGDAGSMLLGFLIGWAAVRLAAGRGAESLPPVTGLWIVALPLIDMFACMIRRPLEGKTPMSADRRHLHHLLMASGLSVRQAVGALHLMAIAFALVGIIGWRWEVPAYGLFWTLVGLFVGYTVFSISFWRRHPDTVRHLSTGASGGITASESRGYSI